MVHGRAMASDRGVGEPRRPHSRHAPDHVPSRRGDARRVRADLRVTHRDTLRRLARTFAPIQPRRALLAIGRHMGARSLTRAANLLGGLEQGSWLARTGADVPNLGDRFAVFDVALRHVHGARPLYLEFGVYRGRTLRWWAEHLTARSASFVGFDSFEGLPEDWQPGAGRGSFAVSKPPQIDDPRVSFVVGWFEETLPPWEPPPHDQLIVNVDCDLYSSTKLVLEWLTPHVGNGSLVYFDDLFNRDHQWRALHEWLDAGFVSARPVAMARWGHHLLFEVQSGAATGAARAETSSL
jgi:hypothetical protein